MSINNISFLGIADFGRQVKEVRNKAVGKFKENKKAEGKAEGSFSKSISVGSKEYVIEAFVSLHSNPIARFFGCKKTQIIVHECSTLEKMINHRIVTRALNQNFEERPSPTNDVEQPKNQDHTFHFNKGKGLKKFIKENQNVENQSTQDKKTKSKSQSVLPHQPSDITEQSIRGSKIFMKRQSPLPSTETVQQPPKTPTPTNDETIMDDLKQNIPALENMQDLRKNKLGTLKTSMDSLNEAIKSKKYKSPNFQEINESAANIISQKAKLLRQANETLNNLDQTTYTGTSGTPHKTDDIKRILKNNITFNENSFKVELVRAQNIINITAAHANGASLKDLQAINNKQNDMQKLFEYEQQVACTPNSQMKAILEAQINELKSQIDLEEYNALCQAVEKQYLALMNPTEN
ncbi:MAG: hypothetical protein LBB05_01660 [Puniceicoccales bacterium]|jgi:hypothetical protein|nr:hypothetical protein [Puniceicoccales bacterium]